jgi:hypothetical protein
MRKPRQREFGFANWGGKRRGAGRKPKGERAGVSHAKRPRLAPRFPVLVTSRLRAGLRSLRNRAAHGVLASALAAGSRGEFRVVEYSAQSNHLHLLVEAQDERTLGRGMQGLGVRIASALNRLWGRAGSVFADRYHARILESPRAVRNALRYVLNNARKHGAWSGPAPDPFSSGSFDGWKRTSGGDLERRSRFLPLARSWLLALGWRRHGLLDPREAPRAHPPDAPNYRAARP